MNLLSKIENKDAIIAIVGLGYVGIPLALIYVEAGFKVVGIDIDTEKVNSLNNGLSYIAVSYTHLTLPTNREV